MGMVREGDWVYAYMFVYMCDGLSGHENVHARAYCRFLEKVLETCV